MTISQAKFEPETHHHDESIYTIDTAISFDYEISQTSLEMNIDYLETEKSKLSGKERQSLRNELDLILVKARARLDKLQSLTLLEINLERILIDQKQITASQNRYPAKDIWFDRIRSMENGLLDNGFTKKSEVNDQKVQVQKPRKTLEDILRDLEISLPSREALISDAMTFEEPSTHYTSTSVEVPTVAPRQEEVEDIIQYLKDQKILYFHHVTSDQNCDSIKKAGFLSWQELERRNINYHNEVAGPASKSLDRRYNKQDYVRFSFCKASPMFYAGGNQFKQNNIIYRISVECLRDSQFEFSNMNATDNNVTIGNSLDFLRNRVRLDLISLNYKRLSDIEKKYFQAEILIKSHVPAEFIVDTIPF